MSIRFIFVFTLLLILGNLAGQNSPGLKDIILPAPTAAALGKYGETPVSFYTGIPEITIPIYTIKTGDIELPISLSYHAGGIKLEERPSNVGIGWSLNAGGVITRSIRGLPDKKNSSSHYQSLVPVAKRYPMKNNPVNLINGGNAIESDFPVLNNILNRYVDGEPDIYYFNFGGYTGSFFMAEDGQFVVSPLQAIKIENSSDFNYSVDDVTKWTLTTPDGFKYIFGVSEDDLRSGLEKNVIQGVREAITSWYLMDIISPTNNTIALDYNVQQYSYYTKSGEAINELLLDHPGHTTQELPHYEAKYIQNVIKEPSPKSITFKEGKITFAVSTLDEGYKIDQISVYNKENITQPLKKFSFTYSFSTSRLTLSYFSEISSVSGVSNRTYSFIYNGALPSLNPYSIAMNGQDLWGYYNGVLTNTMLPPTYTLYDYETPVNFAGADRHTSESNMKKGTLEKIIYPTGGSTEFEYEANTVYSNGYSNGIPMQPTPKSVMVSYGIGQTKTVNFTISNAENGKAQVFINIDPLLPGCPVVNGISECNNAYIEGVNGTNFHSSPLREGFSHLELANGDYRFVGSGVSIPGAPSNNMFYIKLEWNEFPELANGQHTPSNVIIGGLRIRKIISKGAYGEVLNVRKYLYNKFSDINNSSGVLVNYPIPPMTTYKYFSPPWSTPDPVLGIGNYKLYAQIQSSTQLPLSPTHGATVGYENVTELQGENGENGKTEFTFKTAKDEPDNIQQYRPFPPNVSFDFRRGKLVKETIYNLKAGVFTRVRETVNTYNVGNNQKIGYGVIVDLQKFGNSGPIDFLRLAEDYYVAGTRMISEFGYLESTTVKTYDPNNSSLFVEEKTDFTYDLTKGHYQLVKSVTTRSDQRSKETIYKYPQDLSLTGSAEIARAALVSKHILNPVLQSISKVGNTQTFQTNNNYKAFTNGILAPENIETKTGAYNIELRLQFTNYDSYGNLLSQQKTNDVKISYEWGYQNTYPIVEIKNAENSLATTTTTGTTIGTLNLPGNLATASFTSTAAGNIVLTALADPGSTYSISYSLTGPSNKSGYLCVSRSSTSCSYPETVTLTGMPAGSYNLTITYYSGNSPYKGASYIYPVSQTTTTGIKEFFFEGFEENSSSSVITNPSTAHSGRKYWNGSFTVPFSKPNSRTYIIQWWKLTGGKWQMNQQTFTNNMVLTGPVDDIRVFPSDAMMTTYTYDPLIGMTSQTDPSGKTITYEYDGFGRLKTVRDQDKNVLKTMDYQYQAPNNQ